MVSTIKSVIDYFENKNNETLVKFYNILLRIKCSQIHEISTPPWLRRLRCFYSRSEGCEVEPPQDTFDKALETFTLVTPQKKNMQQSAKVGKWMHGYECGCERKHHGIRWGKLRYL